MVLFDKHEKPVLRGMTEDAAWAAVEEYEDYVYNNALSYSDDNWDKALDEVRALYDELFKLFE